MSSVHKYAAEHGYIKNEQGFNAHPPKEAEGKNVDILLTGTMIEHPEGFEIKHNQNPHEWDWQDQRGVNVEYWRISRG